MLNVDSSQKRFAIYCLMIMALALFLLKVPFVFKNHFGGGDGIFRMQNAHQLILASGNRIWLPFLQMHIWVLHKLKLPYYAFKLIPCFYFLLALLFLGKLAHKIIGRPELIFSSLMLFCFAYQRGVIFLSVNPYQEMLAIALFFILLHMGVLDLKKSKILLVIAGASLLTRDSFWVYLFVISLLNYRKILSDKTYLYAFISLWAIPLLWMGSAPLAYLIKLGRLPQFPLEYPLMITKKVSAISNPLISLRSLGESMARNKIPFLIIGLVIAQVSKALYLRTKKKEMIQRGTFDAKFKVFSITSLTIIYSYILLFNPYEYTFGNMRMGIPLLTHLFIWVLLFYKETFNYPKALKVFVRSVLILSILLIIHGRAANYFSKIILMQ